SARRQRMRPSFPYPLSLRVKADSDHFPSAVVTLVRQRQHRLVFVRVAVGVARIVGGEVMAFAHAASLLRAHALGAMVATGEALAAGFERRADQFQAVPPAPR